MNKDSWGGGIEVSILSSYYQTEIDVVDCQTGRIDRFGEDKHFPQRVFLLYDGVHYDPLFLEAPDGSGVVLQTRFATSDDTVMAQALDIGNEAKSSGQFTNVAEFSLRCLICRAPLKGQKEAQQHAVSTGHVNFGEYRP
jgi:ubiquitin thioesterase OTU1